MPRHCIFYRHRVTILFNSHNIFVIVTGKTVTMLEINRYCKMPFVFTAMLDKYFCEYEQPILEIIIILKPAYFSAVYAA